MVDAAGRLSVRIRLLIIALLPILILMPLLLTVTLQRATSRSDQLLATRVASDLTVARQYLAHLLDETDAKLAALAQSVALREALSGDIEAFLAEQRQKLHLDFLRLAVPGVAGFATPGHGLEVLTPAQLAALSPELPQRARVPLAGGGNETRGMVIRATARVQLAGGGEMGLSGGLLLNRNDDFVDQINRLVYPAAGPGLADELGKHFDRGITTLFLDDIRIATTLRPTGGARAIGTRAAADVRERVLVGGQSFHDTAYVVNDWYISAYEPITDRQGAKLGMIYVGIPKAPYTAARRLNATVTAAAFLAMTLLTVPLFLIWARGIFRPLEAMGRTLSRVEAGDLGARSLEAGPQPAAADEILRLARHLDRLLALLQQRDGELRGLNADLNQRVEARTADLLAANRALERATQQLVLSEKLATIGEVTAGVAHEINNPLAVTLGNIEVLRMVLGRAADPVSTELQLIEEQMQRIGALANQLLQFAKPHEPADGPKFSDPRAVLAAVDAAFRHLPGAEHIELRLEASARRMVSINPHELQQVLTNLVSNAMQSMPDGGVIELRAEDAMSGDAMAGEAIAGDALAGVLFTVKDCGDGMAAPTLARIFDPFFTTRGVRGTGLGLAICQSIIHRHGGRIVVESQPGQGTTFRFWLPVTL